MAANSGMWNYTRYTDSLKKKHLINNLPFKEIYWKDNAKKAANLVMSL